ncbi:MAG: DUF2283 domain-containing protein [Candidatus Omnitrophica bacterium]|nr:DUF2283 domain-containing protein [Candidatus Omnitrophota bacterium]
MKKAIHIKTQKPISFSLDALARAIYIGFSNNPIEKTTRKNKSLLMDYDKDGNIVGIEIIRVQKAKATITKVLKDTEKDLPVSLRKTIDSYLQPLGV